MRLKAEKIGSDAVSVDGFECGGHPGEDDMALSDGLEREIPPCVLSCFKEKATPSPQAAKSPAFALHRMAKMDPVRLFVSSAISAA